MEMRQKTMGKFAYIPALPGQFFLDFCLGQAECPAVHRMQKTRQLPRPTNNRKEKIRMLTSLLFFCLLSDMLTKVSVIFLLCKSDIKPVGLSVILFAANSRSEYHSAQAEYNCEAISLDAGEYSCVILR